MLRVRSTMLALFLICDPQLVRVDGSKSSFYLPLYGRNLKHSFKLPPMFWVKSPTYRSSICVSQCCCIDYPRCTLVSNFFHFCCCFLSLKYYFFFYLTKCLGCCLHSFYHCRTWRRKLAQPDFQSVLNLICHIFWVWHHACYLSDRQEQQPGSALPAVRGALCMLSGRRSIEYAWVSVLRQTRSLFQPKSSQLFLYLPVLDWTREPSIFLLFKKLVVI